jgi:hypothetical protein
VRQFGWGESNIQRQQNRPGFENTVIRLQETMAIQTEKCDPVTPTYSRIAQSACQTARALREFRVGEALLPADYGSFPWKLLLGIA